MALTEDRMKDLIQLAKDILADKVFTSNHLRDSEKESMLHLIFLPLVFLKEDTLEKMKDVVLLYEYYDKSIAGRGINGCPIFGSVAYLNTEEYNFMVDKMHEIKALLDSI